jgi:predicted nuclease of predicted toxin-antitoxin system
VRFLLDENLSRRLIGQLVDLFPGSVHVSSEQLLQASDIAVWEYAKSFGFSIITADAGSSTNDLAVYGAGSITKRTS